MVTPVRDPSNPEDGIKEFLVFLEQACQRVRPAYDGVLLLSYDQASRDFGRRTSAAGIKHVQYIFFLTLALLRRASF